MSDKIRKYLRGEKGFTLVEMMVVLIIIAVLIAGGIRFYLGYIGRSKITKATGDISTMQAALDSYYAQNNKYPNADDASILAAGLSTEMISGNAAAATTIPYRYTTGGVTFNPSPPAGVPTNGYLIFTREAIDGTNFVVGTGAGGISSPANTTH